MWRPPDALSLHPSGHPARLAPLNNLAGSFISRYERIEEIENVSEVIILAKDALSLCPPGRLDVGSRSRVSKSSGNGWLRSSRNGL